MLVAPTTQHQIRDPDDSPIFIIGTGRSGTTLLRQMLNAHPRIHITHEAGFYSYFRHAPPEQPVRDWLERYFETFSFAWLRLDPQAVLADLPADLSRDRVADAFRAIMRQKARLLHKPRYGEKNPLDTHNLPQIFRDFRDPRVVCIMRDPRPTVLSFNRMPFGTSSALINSHLCRVQFEHLRPFLDRILEVRLEDLVADPKAALAGILRFVGEPWDDAVLDHLSRGGSDDVPPLPWFVGATREGLSARTSGGGWERHMDPAWIRLVESINREAMARYGYEPAQLAREPGALSRAAALVRDMPGMVEAAYRLLGFKRRLDRHFQGKELMDPQRAMEENVRLNPAAWRHYPAFEMPLVPRLSSSSGGPVTAR